MGFSRQQCWSGLPFPSPGDLPNPGIEPRSSSLQVDFFQLSHKGSPRILEWVAYPFSSGFSQPRNWTGVSCIAGGFFTSWAMREFYTNTYWFVPLNRLPLFAPTPSFASGGHHQFAPCTSESVSFWLYSLLCGIFKIPPISDMMQYFIFLWLISGSIIPSSPSVLQQMGLFHSFFVTEWYSIWLSNIPSNGLPWWLSW